MPPKKKATNGYKLPDPLPKGEILEDRSKKKWKLGVSIGKGGFGEIYCAQPADVTGTKYLNVIKIEPHANGPLFVEMHFYMRNGKLEDIEKFKEKKKLSTLGMPAFLGSGSHEFKGEKYRFLVMERFGTDIWKLYLENNKKFPEATVFQMGLQILDVLEYMHERNYVHMDIKGANVLLGLTKETKDKQVYLVDFGLATKYSTEKEFKPNPKKAHDGTIEYLSRDAHKGVPTRRGDLEILVYNLIHWLGCTLPWEKNLSDPKIVEKSKEENMETVAKMIKACFGTKKPPAAITEYLNYLKTLKFDTEPDYEKLRKILTKGVKEAGGKIGSVLKFSTSSTTTPSKTKRKSDAVASTPNRKQRKLDPNQDSVSESEEETEQEKSPKKRKTGAKQKPKPQESDESEQEDSPTRRSPRTPQKQVNGTPVRKRGKAAPKPKDSDESEPEEPTKRTTRRTPQKQVNGTTNKKRATVKPKKATDDTEVIYTEAMKEIVLKQQEKAKKPGRPRRATVDVPPNDDQFKGYTESMRELAMKRNAKKTATKVAK